MATSQDRLFATALPKAAHAAVASTILFSRARTLSMPSSSASTRASSTRSSASSAQCRSSTSSGSSGASTAHASPCGLRDPIMRVPCRVGWRAVMLLRPARCPVGRRRPLRWLTVAPPWDLVSPPPASGTGWPVRRGKDRLAWSAPTSSGPAEAGVVSPLWTICAPIPAVSMAAYLSALSAISRSVPGTPRTPTKNYPASRRSSTPLGPRRPERGAARRERVGRYPGSGNVPVGSARVDSGGGPDQSNGRDHHHAHLLVVQHTDP
jgi:hypothetical protein